MNEAIQQAGKEVSIVIYDAPLPPKYFRFSKRFIRALFLTLPVIFILMLSALFLWGLANRVKEAPRPKLPQITDEKALRIAELEKELSDVRESNLSLVEKIGSSASSNTDGEVYLMGVRRPYGMQNLTAQKIVSLDHFEFRQEANRTSLKFEIVNPSPTRKVSGHIIVFMVSESGVLAYPEGIGTRFMDGAKYSEGESFGVSRLRPTTAEFQLRPVGKMVKFLIYIFNREGDLLVSTETEKFDLGPRT